MIPKRIVANWKQNPDKLETALKLLEISENFATNLTLTLGNKFSFLISHSAPSLYAGILIEKKKTEKQLWDIILQDISVFKSGSHTGEISAAQAKNLEIEMSIVGHSETRKNLLNPSGFTNAEVNLKIKNLVDLDMFAVVCIGEETREGVDYKKVLANQLDECLKDISVEKLEYVRIAYEPIWAIGEKAIRPATLTEIQETLQYIEDYLYTVFPTVSFMILYGGSVNEKNAKEIVELDTVDGLLIGRASSDPEKWQKLLDNLI